MRIALLKAELFFDAHGKFQNVRVYANEGVKILEIEYVEFDCEKKFKPMMVNLEKVQSEQSKSKKFKSMVVKAEKVESFKVK